MPKTFEAKLDAITAFGDLAALSGATKIGGSSSQLAGDLDSAVRDLTVTESIDAEGDIQNVTISATFAGASRCP